MNEHTIPNVAIEDTVAAAKSFAAAKRVEEAVRESAMTGTLTFTNFSGTMLTQLGPAHSQRTECHPKPE